MSLKENINYIKEEVSAQESFMEKTFKLEQFYKKYKTIIFGSVTLAVIAFIGVSVTQYQNEQNKIKDNQAFNLLLENPNDKLSLNYLEENNKKLYEIAIYMNDKTKKTNVEFLAELSTYSKAIEKDNIDELSAVTQKQTFLLKDFAIFNKALIQAQNGKYQDAKESIKLIPANSSVASLSSMLEHFLLTK
ncbi:MAG: tetratricopeptide repeat protein [Campylobacterota bacterium]|nr:tetratricopeptide repeat protein [Campylobacterota bacterium]